MDTCVKARLDMIEPGRFFVLYQNDNGSVTGRAFTDISQALEHLDLANDRAHETAIALSLAA